MWQLIVGSGGLIGISVMFFYIVRFFTSIEMSIKQINDRFDNVDKRFDIIDERFDKIDERFDRIYNDLTAIRMDIRNIDCRLSRLEGQDEERFRIQLRDKMTPIGKH